MAQLISFTTALLLLAALATSSCKKDSNTEPVTPVGAVIIQNYPNYMALKPGNYWIYENYKIDMPSGEAHPLGTYDSNYVEKDTTINGRVYNKYRNTTFGSSATNPTYKTYYLRDSLSYTVDRSGSIYFSSEDFTSIFRRDTLEPGSASPDTLYITEQMGFKNTLTVVPAGTFATHSFRQVYLFPAGYPYGPTREYNWRYAKNIGLISNTTGFYSGTPEYYERRLVRYRVQ